MPIEKKISTLISRYVFQNAPAKRLSSYILRRYKSRIRLFHDLNYLDSLWKILTKYEGQLQDPDALKFALCFHKIRVSSFSSNKLTTSHKKARKILRKLSLSQVQLDQISDLLIKAAEPWKYTSEKNIDNLLLMDLVRVPLGAEKAEYQKYLKKIRKESALIPSSTFRKKRTDLINKLLSVSELYHLDEFVERYESNARQNLLDELKFYSTQ